MTITEILAVVALLMTAVLMGSMAFFSFVMAPLIFVRLEMQVAGQFVRAAFPWYYLLICVLAGVGGLCLVAVLPVDGSVLLLVAVSALYCRQSLMPRINQHRDRSLAGDQQAGRTFNRQHRLSEVINALQLLAVFAVLVHLALLIELG